MCTGAWLRATRRIISRSRSMAGAAPMSWVPVRVDIDVSADWETFNAVDTMRRRTPRSSGLETKSKAPSFNARTADSTFPCAVMTAQGTPGQCVPIHSSRSRPSPSGSRMSVRHRSNFCALRSFFAVATSPADCVASCMRDNVSVTSSTRSGSSSTTRTNGGAMRRLAYSGHPAFGVAEHESEQTAAAGAWLIKESSAIGLRKLACEEQTQARTALIAGEEGLENLFAMLNRNSRPAVGHLEKRPRCRGHASHPQLDDFGFRFMGAVLHRVFAEVPDDLPQLRRVHLDFHVG